MDKHTACVIDAEIVEQEQSLVRASEIAGEPGVLATVSTCRAMLARATGTPQLTTLRDYLSTVEKALKLRGEARALQNEVAETKLRAERRLGELIKESGARPGNPQLSRDATIGKLPDGVTRIQAMRWRRESEVPDAVFEKWVAEIKASGDDDLTSAGLLRLRDQFTVWAKEVKKQEPAKLAPQEREALGSEFARESAARRQLRDRTRPRGWHDVLQQAVRAGRLHPQFGAPIERVRARERHAEGALPAIPGQARRPRGELREVRRAALGGGQSAAVDFRGERSRWLGRSPSDAAQCRQRRGVQ